MLHELLSLGPILLIIVFTALTFDFVNGWNDSANAIATVIATRVMTPFQAVLLAAGCNLLGGLAGVSVAKTVTAGIISTDPSVIPPEIILLVVLAALLSAIIWAAVMTIIGMPISGTHSLIGGMVGAGFAAAGPQAIIFEGIQKVLLALLISPALGAFVALILALIGSWLFFPVHATVVNRLFRGLQLLSSGAMAFAHGLNDAQKVMGIITLALVAGKVQTTVIGDIPEPEDWVRITCALVIGLGTAVGGWRVIRTLGMNLSKLTPFDGFNAETGAAVVLTTAASFGIPVSTTHTITGAIVGVGLKNGARSVRWSIGQKILLAWILTLPGTFIMGACFYLFLTLFH